MTQQTAEPLRAARALVGDLRALGMVEAPDGLLVAVLGRTGARDTYFAIESPLGQVFIAYNHAGIATVMRADAPVEFERAFQAQFGRPAYAASEPPAHLARAVARRLAGEGASELRFDLRSLSEFERAVLLKALEIPRGQVRPYGWIAREIGRPKAVRAVGTALAHNPVPLLIPCHRVTKSDGYLGRYSLGGAENKRIMLQFEGADPDAIEARARAGVRYWGSDTTHVYCFPTCHHAHRVADRHRLTFRSAAEAAAAGCRPCKVCRPALTSQVS